MISTREVKRWLETLDPDGEVAIDDGGLAIIEIDKDGEPTGAYLEAGGIPLEGDRDE